MPHDQPIMTNFNTNRLIFIVTGVQLPSELNDRPLAYRLQNLMLEWLQEHCPNAKEQLLPIVMSDVLHVNDRALHHRPVISIGAPESNALSAYLYPRLSTALQIEERLFIQLDVEMTDLRVNLWGSDPYQTSASIDLFESRYLNDFMEATITQSDISH